MILNSLKRQFNNHKNKTYLLLLSIECEFMKIINSLDVKVLDISHFFLCTSVFTWVVRLKKNPAMSNTDRFFCLNSTVYFTYSYSQPVKYPIRAASVVLIVMYPTCTIILVLQKHIPTTTLKWVYWFVFRQASVPFIKYQVLEITKYTSLRFFLS
jgi:hypothetical protein